MGSALAVAARPRLWTTAVRMAWRCSPPTRSYLQFRMITAYGDATAAPHPHDTVAYLDWCRSWHAAVDG